MNNVTNIDNKTVAKRKPKAKKAPKKVVAKKKAAPVAPTPPKAGAAIVKPILRASATPVGIVTEKHSGWNVGASPVKNKLFVKSRMGRVIASTSKRASMTADEHKANTQLLTGAYAMKQGIENLAAAKSEKAREKAILELVQLGGMLPGTEDVTQ